MASTGPQQLRVLTLNSGEDNSNKLFTLKKGWTLHFVLGPSLVGKNVTIFTNHPLTDLEGEFEREKFETLTWYNYTESTAEAYDNYASVKIILAGTFQYFFTVDEEKNCHGGMGYFIASPHLSFGNSASSSSTSDLCSVRCQTVISKLLGPVDQWLDRLRVSKLSGYNMIHFTPTQELGESKSAYCIKDQLSTNPEFQTKDTPSEPYKGVKEVVDHMSDMWKILSMADLVLNHTATESPWLRDQPECAYSTATAPHLRPAYMLDRALWRLTLDLEDTGAGEIGVGNHTAVEEIANKMQNDILPELRLHEFYLMHIDHTVEAYLKALKGYEVSEHTADESLQLSIIQDPEYKRLNSTIDMGIALAKYAQHGQDTQELREYLECLNHSRYLEIQNHVTAALNNLLENIAWRFTSNTGLKLGMVAEETPLMWNYFTMPDILPKSMIEEEALMDGPLSKYCMAHNGWVMNADPLINFAEKGSLVYLRRELIPWGDSVKLRYGDCKEDAPALWTHMAEYARLTAKTFHAVRLDNCHSTPIHVAKYMLAEARKVRPDLYVIAELFTNDAELDTIYINQLGLNSLVREAIGANDSAAMARCIHEAGISIIGSLLQPPARHLYPTAPGVILMDQTHDNDTYTEKRTVYDTLPTSALCAMSLASTGSNRGSDELVPYHINVVTENRLYRSYSADLVRSGIMEAKWFLNELHATMIDSGYTQIFVHDQGHDVITITRHNPVNHRSIVMITRSKFTDSASEAVVDVTVTGKIGKLIGEASLTWDEDYTPLESQGQDAALIQGQSYYKCTIRKDLDIKDSQSIRLKPIDNEVTSTVTLYNLKPGSFVCFSVMMNEVGKKSILQVRQLLSMFGYRMKTYSGRDLSLISGNKLEQIVSRLSLAAINRVLFRVEGEASYDHLYSIPTFGNLLYCGLQGVVSVITDIRKSNNLAHPLCSNLRAGDWLMDYIASRLMVHPSTEELGSWFRSVFLQLRLVPRHLIPCYFCAIVEGVHTLVEEVACAQMSSFVKDGSSFERSLAISSLQFIAEVEDGRLPVVVTPSSTEQSMSAGLPHFVAGVWRNWGRDTFISYRGLLLLTGRLDVARDHLLGYAGAIKYGLIPNLLSDRGLDARYNCRDAVWFWLECVKSTYHYDESILGMQVHRLYNSDDEVIHDPETKSVPLHSVVQEVMQRHAQGIHFREMHTDTCDADMQDQGFNVDVGVDWPATGFVTGGNTYNCGTWMDKMGSKEGLNKGIPATPRDGAAVEIVAICKSMVSWLAELHSEGKYPYSGVNMAVSGSAKGDRVPVSYDEWAKRIQLNFEPNFFIPSDCIEPMANQRLIYKDTFGASQSWADYQLRPNFAIAMSVAPELFDEQHAIQALAKVRTLLLGPLGVKTLDESDLHYNGYYDNDDGTRGFNYHQGPEWVWPIGYYIRASLLFCDDLGATLSRVNATLSPHYNRVKTSGWRSLPELTNRDGAECSKSCGAQAWSVATILEALAAIRIATEKLNPE